MRALRHIELQGIPIIEERRLAGRLAGALYGVGALTSLSVLALPGVKVTHPGVVVAMAALSLAYAACALLLIPWERASPLVPHGATLAGLPIIGIVVACTGGATAPTRFYDLFVFVFATYFFSPREALPYVGAAIVLHAVPLLYVHGPLGPPVAENLVLGPAYAVLGGLLMAGKAKLVELRDQARALALHDALTGLPNRRALIEELDRALAAAPDGAGVGLVLVDLDNFKDANTLHGHQAGDLVLCATATALVEGARAEDVVARLGGDEFAVVASRLDDAGMRALADRLVASVRLMHSGLDLPGVRISASAGWAVTPSDATTTATLIAAADAGLRASKRVGKDRASAPVRAVGPTALAG